MKELSAPSLQGYELLEQIGVGGFSTVYRAYQSTVGREVAIKIIKPTLANNADFIRRFENEAQLVARLEHIHIVPLYDFWRDPQGAYLVMRWLRGGSLKDALHEGPFDPRMASIMLDHVSSGLASAHAHNIIHRDIKPSNILLDEEGNAYLADFGIAADIRVNGDGVTNRPGKATSHQGQRLPGRNQIAGSLAYLAPELLRGQDPTPQSDIYSLGITVFEALTGRHPFPGLTSVQQLFNQINEPLPRIDSIDPSISDEVQQVIQKATVKNPKYRYQDALTLATDFHEAVGLGQNVGTADVVESLTRREQEILYLITQGKTNKQIAQALFVELSTVKWHITQLYKKLGVRSRVQATVRARELDLIISTQDIDGETQAATSTSIVLAEPENPYKGLRSFKPADSRDYFGREALVDALVAQFTPTRPPTLATKSDGDRFLAIVGPSGSGKSSLLKAGLIPAFWSGKVPGSEKWFIIDMVPGARPLDELEIGLTRVAADQGNNLRSTLERDNYGLLRAANLILPNDDSELLVIVDQFEELFSLVTDESARRQFMNLIREAVLDPRSRVRVIISIRADFYDRPLQYPDFGELIIEHSEVLLPLSAEELERAILGPAERVGVTFESGLVATIIEEVNYRPGSLPLLQFALTELFEHRHGRLLTGEAYTTFGGASGALAGRAEELFQERSTLEQEEIHQLFLRLVTVGGKNYASDFDFPSEDLWLVHSDMRRRVLRSELLSASSDPDRLDEIIDTYADHRLLSLDHQPMTRQPTVEVAHEALLREWGRLRDWLVESSADLAQHRQIMRVAAEWVEAGKDWSFLLRGTRLDQFESWSATTGIALTAEERAFLDASLANREERAALEQERQVHETQLERRARRRLKALLVVLASALFLSLGLTIITINYARLAQEQERLAVSRELAAAALSQLRSDPELSVLLAITAAEHTYLADGVLLPEVEDALHKVIQADRLYRSFKSLDGALDYSPDGEMLAFRDAEDGLLKLWDANTGELVRELGAHLHDVTDITFNADGRLLASSGDDTLVRLWDVSTGREIAVLLGHDDLVHDIDFSPDSTRLATASKDQEVKVWEIDTIKPEGSRAVQLSEPVLTLHPPDDPTGVAFSPDGEQIAAYLPDSSVLVWDALTGKKLLSIPGTGSFITGIDFSPDGTILAGAVGSVGAALWDANTGQEILRLPAPSPITDVDFSHDGRFLVTAGEDGTAIIWDTENAQELLRLSGHSSRIKRAVFSPDDHYLATGDGRKVNVWDVSTSGSRELFTLAAHDGAVHDVVYSPDGSRLASTGEDGKIKLWDAQDGTLLWSEPGMSLANFPAFNPGGDRLAAANDEGGISIWDVPTGEELLKLRGVDPAWISVAFSPDGKKVVAGSPLGIVQFWDALTGQRLIEFHNQDEPILRLGFFPKGLLETFDGSGNLTAWDPATGEQLCQCNLTNDTIWDEELSPNGRNQAIASWDGTAEVFLFEEFPCDENFRSQYLLRRHSGNVTGVAYNPDGSRLATSGFDSTVRLWDMTTGEQSLVLSGHTLPVTGVDFTPDGRYLAAAGSDGTIRVYIMSTTDLLAEARSRVTRDLTRDECRRYLHLDTCPEG